MSNDYDLIKRDCGAYLCDECGKKATYGMRKSNIQTLCDKHGKEYLEKGSK